MCDESLHMDSRKRSVTVKVNRPLKIELEQHGIRRWRTVKKKKKKKREIRIFAPFRPTVRPEEATMKAQRKALEEERFGVLELSRRIGRKFSPLPVIVGASLLITSIYLVITNTFLMADSPEIKAFFIALSIFLGVINVVAGLLLMGSD